MRGKILAKIKYIMVAVGLVVAGGMPGIRVQAEGCPDLKIVFARGSGGERWVDKNYVGFRSTIESKLGGMALNYEFIDLDYPAIGINDASVLIGAYVGAGEAYEFGESVKSGVKKLDKMVNGASCPNTKYVLGGYSQGAMVVSRALSSLNADRIIYATTFGDPKIYLPEGEGAMPAACRGENLSDYRMYVPDCQAYKGLLGAYVPYEPEAFAGKVGTWCNKRDIFCSSRLSISDHTGYVADNLYEDAARVIVDKIAKTYGLENRISSPHDTAILIDSTGSMTSMIERYKTEALRLAKETLDAGGRVALFDYRDLDDPYDLVQHCEFENCTLEKFTAELSAIQADGGGDTPESLLSGAFHAMRALKWKQGATKSLVVLTDSNFLSPDRDGISFDGVIRLSKKIDPVNFYIITSEESAEDYAGLAAQTDGLVVTNFDELNLLTDYIMERYDSLPRVEENLEPATVPTLEITAVTPISTNETNVAFNTDGERTLVILNDAVLGVTEENAVTLGGLKAEVENILTLVPLGAEVRGEGVTVRLGGYGSSGYEETASLPTANTKWLPKAPDTGRWQEI